MKVLKFGGTSVANAKNIRHVAAIVAQSDAKKQVVVVSALGGVTDMLLQTATLAAAQDNSYKKILQKIESRHITTIQELIPLKKQSKVLSTVKSELNTLETLLEGASLIGEITPKLSDKIVSYGELLSSYIIYAFFTSEKLDASHVDSRTLIITNDNYGKATVDFKHTNTACTTYFKKEKQAIVVLGGFIASSVNGNSTTLGRGGSDYTAAIVAAAINAKELQIWTCLLYTSDAADE